MKASGLRRLSLYSRTINLAAAWLTPRRVQVYPAALSLSIIVFLAWAEIAALSSGMPFAQTLGGDFVVFYTGGRFFLEGRLAEIYDSSAQQAFQAGLGARVLPKPKGFITFANPPFTVILYAPFAWGGYVPGLFLWWGAGLCALAFSLYLLRQELAPSSTSPVLRWLMMSFLFFPTLAWFFFGQSTALTLLVYTLTLFMLRRGRDFAAGAALGILLYKPQLAIALTVMLVVKRRWRALLGGLLSITLWLAIGFAIGPSAMWEYVRLGSSFFQTVNSADWPGYGFTESSALSFSSLWPTGAAILGAGLTAGGLIAVGIWWRRTPWRPGTRAWDFTLAATIALGLLISPHLTLYDLMLLLVPLFIVWSHYSGGSNGRPLDGGPLLAWTALLYAATLTSDLVSVAQLQLSAALGFPRVAFQWGVPVIVGWAWVVSHLAHKSTVTDPAPRLLDDSVLLSAK